MIERLTYRLQQYCAAASGLLVALAAITVVLATCVKQASLSENADKAFKDMPPGQAFAKIDGRPETFAAYDQWLDRLDKKCLEGRNESALIVFTLHNQYKKDGFNGTLFDTLKDYTETAEFEFQRVDSCFDLYQRLTD